MRLVLRVFASVSGVGDAAHRDIGYLINIGDLAEWGAFHVEANRAIPGMDSLVVLFLTEEGVATCDDGLFGLQIQSVRLLDNSIRKSFGRGNLNDLNAGDKAKGVSDLGGI